MPLYRDRNLGNPSCSDAAWHRWHGRGWAQAHLGHSPVQDNTALLGEGLLGAQQVVNEQRDAGKAVPFQSVQVLQGRGTQGQWPPLLGGPEPREMRDGRQSRQRRCSLMPCHRPGAFLRGGPAPKTVPLACCTDCVLSMARFSSAKEASDVAASSSPPKAIPPWSGRRGGAGRSPGPTHVSGLDDEVPGLAIPQHRQHVLLLALALPHQEVPGVCQQLGHLCPWDGPMVPQLLMQGLLHLWHELQGWRELAGVGRGKGHSASLPGEATRTDGGQLGWGGLSLSHLCPSSSQTTCVALEPPEQATD